MSNYQKEFGRDSMLPIWALVLSIVLPPIGAIMGHVALSQMRKGEISSINRNFASAATFVGWICTVLIFIPLLLIFMITVGLQNFFGSLTYS